MRFLKLHKFLFLYLIQAENGTVLPAVYSNGVVELVVSSKEGIMLTVSCVVLSCFVLSFLVLLIHC